MNWIETSRYQCQAVVLLLSAASPRRHKPCTNATLRPFSMGSGGSGGSGGNTLSGIRVVLYIQYIRHGRTYLILAPRPSKTCFVLDKLPCTCDRPLWYETSPSL